MKLLIVGGVAGGASAAARARRLNEDAEIILFERGRFISFANCGLPYHIGGAIPKRNNLILMTPEGFKKRTNINVRIGHEVISVNPEDKTISVKDIDNNKIYEESYDKLILSTGSSPIRPPIPGADDPDVMVLWTIPDMDRILNSINKNAKRAIVIGGGFIGMEIAENLTEKGIDTTVVEMLPQVMANLDPEMSQPVSETLARHGIKLFLDNGVTKITRTSINNDSATELIVTLKDGAELKTDFIIMSIGVRPNSELAKKAGLKIGERGGIIVDEYLRTSNHDIYAVGDAIQTTDLIRNTPAQIPLAGPANRQGRISAENALGGKATYKGAVGAAVCKIFDLTVASVGNNEKILKQSGTEYEKIYIHPFSHATYYPNAKPMSIKLIFNKNGVILGAQIIGQNGVDKRIDVLSTAIQANMTVYDLEELELAYSPPFSSAKDPVNFAGFVAANILKGTSDIVHVDNMPKDSFLLDVREKEELKTGVIQGYYHIPIGDLRSRLDELPKDRLIVIYCKVGLRGYLAERILKQNGFNAKNLSGGIITWDAFNPAPLDSIKKITKPSSGQDNGINITQQNIPDASIDLCGMQCPGPIVSVKQKLEKINSGEILHITASDPGFMKDLPLWCESTGNKLIDINKCDNIIKAHIQKCDNTKNNLPACDSSGVKKSAAIVMFSNDLDKVLAGFIIGTGFASLGHDVTIFFTFWGLNVLRKDSHTPVKKDLLSRMFGWMMPRGANKLALSKMHMAGLGTGMMKHVMAQKNVDSLPELISKARDMGIKFIACEMAMDIMGIQKEELIDNIETAGVASFAAIAEKSGTTLFI